MEFTQARMPLLPFGEKVGMRGVQRNNFNILLFHQLFNPHPNPLPKLGEGTSGFDRPNLYIIILGDFRHKMTGLGKCH